MSAGDGTHTPVAFTFFPDFAATTKQEEALDLHEMAGRIASTNAPTKAALPWVKGAKFGDTKTPLVQKPDGKWTGGSLRHNGNVLAITAIEGDYDGEIVSFAQACEILRTVGVRSLVYTSPSHCEDAPRWRVVCPLSAEYPPAHRDRFMARINGLFEGIFSTESWTLSQSFYFGAVNRNPSHHVEIIDGTPIDLLEELDAGAVGKPGRNRANTEHRASNGKKSPDQSREQLAKRYRGYVEALLANVSRAPAGQRHATLLRNATALGGIMVDAGITESDAVSWLLDALPDTDRDCSARQTAIDGLAYGRAEPFVLEDRPRQGGARGANGTEPPPDPPPPEDDDRTSARPNGEAATFFDPWAELQPPTFPIDALPPVLRAFAEDRARTIGADPCALAWAGISAASAALNGSIRLKMKRHDSWSVPPAIWLALVGRPSTMKTPIIDAAWEPLQRAQHIDLDCWRQQLANWHALPKNERDPDEPKPKRRLVSHDGTMEALQDILSRQDRGIGVLRDELAGWLGQLEKYGGAKASGADRAFFLQAFNGGPNVIDRVTRGLVAVNNLLVTICGGIQPDRLRQFSDLTDDGLWQRFVPIIVAPASRGLDERPSSAVICYTDAINGMLIVPGATRVELSEPAHGLRADIERRIFDLEQTDVLGARFASFCGKLVGIWGRLCLVLNYLDPGDAHFIVPLKTAERAATLLFQSVIPCAARVYAATGGAGADIEATRSVAGYILTKQKARVLASDLAHNVRACRGQPLDHVQRVVSPLVAGGWLTPEKDWNPYAWKVSADVHSQFEARTHSEAVRRAAIRDVITGKIGHGAYSQ
jgi:hypothetical protein